MYANNAKQNNPETLKFLSQRLLSTEKKTVVDDGDVIFIILFVMCVFTALRY